ncbi:MAG: hypothetical protein J0I11_18210 [Actinobacteria bacterium]|nr:hypothetical protein [Actinomycetota bacterium]
MPTADLAARRALLKLAATDRQADAAAHDRGTLPEIGVISDGSKRAAELAGKIALAQAEVSDIDAAARKLDAEIDSVRARAARDNERLTSGGAASKELESLQREVESLARRQATLEDEALELMERREVAAAALAAVESELAGVTADVEAATVRRDDRWADIDDEIARLSVQRAALVADVPPDVLAIYTRVRGAGKVAAAALVGDRCGGCQMTLDRQSLEEIRSAADDAVARCPECSAILVRDA